MSVYENQPGPKVREKAARGFVARDDRAVEDLTSRLLVLSQDGVPQGSLEVLLGELAPERKPSPRHQPTWPEISEAVVAFQRGQGVNMNLVGPFRGKGYFRLLPADRVASR